MVSRIGPWLVGLVCVLGMRLGTAERQDEEPSPAPREMSPPDAEPHDANHRADPAECEELQSRVHARLDAIQQEIQEIQELRNLLSGEPIPWPVPAPEHVREDAVREAFEAAAAVAEGAMVLRSLRCDEYPCIGIFERTDDDRSFSGWSSRAFDIMSSAFEELGIGGDAHDAVLLQIGSWRDSQEQNHHVAFALSAAPPDDAMRRRLGQRHWDVRMESY